MPPTGSLVASLDRRLGRYQYLKGLGGCLHLKGALTFRIAAPTRSGQPRPLARASGTKAQSFAVSNILLVIGPVNVGSEFHRDSRTKRLQLGSNNSVLSKLRELSLAINLKSDSDPQ